MSNLIKRDNRTSSAGRPDNTPEIGQWYWVECDEDERGETIKDNREFLFCVRHLASNHVQFARSTRDGNQSWVCVRYRDLLSKTKHEPKWKVIIEEMIQNKACELQEAVTALTDAVQNAGLVAQAGEPRTLLPAVTRNSPEDSKKSLIKLKEETYPELHKRIERITQEITSLHRNLMLPMSIQSGRMSDAVERVDERLFALELYAGLFQGVIEIRQGDAADPNTPIAVRQMVRYMDEESLIDYDDGGMDFKKIEDFDKWVSRDENLNRMCPESRCIVALRVRRNDKDYGRASSLWEAFQFTEMNQANKFTYLLLRNGNQAYRLWAEIDFSPRLLPFRDEFVKQFAKQEYDWNKHEHVDHLITPDDLDYDDHVAKRRKKIYLYNRVMFLIQGLLDRSKVFSPHPPINLGDDAHVSQYLKLVYDEELGLPSSDPPSWEQYVQRCNSKIVKGSWIWSDFYAESDYEYVSYSDSRRLRNGRHRPDVCEVDRISKDRKRVRVKWPWGTRYGRKHRDRYSSWGEWGEWPVDKDRHAWLPIEKVFNYSAYKEGEYKQFLCDAYLKGKYLKWAPQLLGAEKWLKEKLCKKKTKS